MERVKHVDLPSPGLDKGTPDSGCLLYSGQVREAAGTEHATVAEPVLAMGRVLRIVSNAWKPFGCKRLKLIFSAHGCLRMKMHAQKPIAWLKTFGWRGTKQFGGL